MKKFLIYFLFLLFILGSIPLNFAFAENAELYEQVYLSEKEALKVIFEDLKVEKKVIEPTKNQIKTIQKRLRRKIKEKEFTFYIGKDGNKVKKYALILEEIGKHYPITFITGMDENAKVDQVAIMVYREKRGDAVKRKRFLNQFIGKSSKNDIEVNVDIVHLTGATISSWSVSAGVKKAIVLTEELMLQKGES